MAHPHGPIAYIGHVDAGFLHGFDDPDSPDLRQRWNPRLAPFRTAVESLLELQPSGYAMGDLNRRAAEVNQVLTATWDRLLRRRPSGGLPKLSPRDQQLIAENFITRSDAQNYLVFGDPGARLRVST